MVGGFLDVDLNKIVLIEVLEEFEEIVGNFLQIASFTQPVGFGIFLLIGSVLGTLAVDDSCFLL